MAQLIPNIISDSEREQLKKYLKIDDNRADFRPDVKSKHPRWSDTNWPKDIIERSLFKIMPGGFEVEEITFRNDKIALKPHTDNGSPDGAQGKTVMFLLDSDPVAHTITFKNYWTGWAEMGVFFTKNSWSPFTYSLPDKEGNLKKVDDIRDLLDKCIESPNNVENFNVTEEFINELKSLIEKRSLERLPFDRQNKKTGYIQPGPRLNDYSTLTHYDPNKKFDKILHEKYLQHVDINDLHGLEIDQIFEWENGGSIIFDREQIHSSSSCHREKSFVTIFCHEV